MTFCFYFADYMLGFFTGDLIDALLLPGQLINNCLCIWLFDLNFASFWTGISGVNSSQY